MTDEITEDYPGLKVWDARVTGSITAGDSRLPVWAFAPVAVAAGWDEVEKAWPDLYGVTRADFTGFIYGLLDHRKSFARLLCVLADVNRIEAERTEDDDLVWWDEMPDLRRRVRSALEACLAELGDG